jgi:chaperonin cofactor prefoldin
MLKTTDNVGESCVKAEQPTCLMNLERRRDELLNTLERVNKGIKMLKQNPHLIEKLDELSTAVWC